MTDVAHNAERLQILEQWLRSYKPESLLDKAGCLNPELKALAPTGSGRMSANPIANGALVRRALRLPDFREYGPEVMKPAVTELENTPPLGRFMRDIFRLNPDNFRLFGPDETASNKLGAVYEATKKVWLAEFFPEDMDGAELSLDGRVMEMLSEHTLKGWLEGYLLTGRHGLLSTYEAFVHVIDSMFNQHAKWLEISKRLA